MARQAAILIPASAVAVTALALTAASTTSFTLGINQIFAINADQDITIAFGYAAATATTTSYRIPANQQTVFDMGQALKVVEIYNLGTANGSGGQTGSAAANVYILPITVV